MADARKGGKKGRKINRNRLWCESYQRRGQREINKARRLARHLRKYPDDRTALHCFKNLPITAQNKSGYEEAKKAVQ